MVTDKEINEVINEHYKKIPWQYLTNVSYLSVHENAFKAGAKWMQEKMSGTDEEIKELKRLIELGRETDHYNKLEEESHKELARIRKLIDEA